MVAWQVFGRYVLNDTPTWAESLALVLVLYVTMFGAAVGVRDAGHIGLESVIACALRSAISIWFEIVIHVLVGLFGVLMAWHGGVLAVSVMPYKIPILGLSEGVNHVPLVIAGVLIVAVLDRAHPRPDRGQEGRPLLALIILCVCFFVLLLIGVPVAFAIGLSAVATILYEGLPLAVVFQRMTSGMNIFSFLAIPFFIFAGELMLYSGVADRIVNFAQATWSAISAAGSACRTWSPARCSAACPARRSPTSRRWDRS